MTRILLIGTIALLVAAPALAQDADTVRAGLVEALEKTNASDEAVARLEVMARRVTESLDAAELRRLHELPAAKRIRAVVKRWRELRDAEVRDFIETHPDAQRLDRGERVRRALDGKVEAALEDTIDRAMSFGAITDEEADALRALDGREKIRAVRKLAKDVFLAAWEDALPAADLERLRALDARAFWRDPLVRRFRLAAVISAGDRRALRAVPRSERGALVEAVAAGRSLDDFVARGVLPAGLGRRLDAVPPSKRKRVARELKRIHFQSEKRIAVPRGVQEKISPEQRRLLRSMSTAERLEWLRKNHPQRDWNEYEEAFRARRRLERNLERIPRATRRAILRQLTRAERQRLQRMSAREQMRFLRRRFPDVPWPR